MRILGISCYYHDSAAVLLDDGVVVAAAQEERFSRRKHDSGFPSAATRYCLSEAGIDADAVELVAFYEKPLIKFERLLETYLRFAPRGLRSFRTAVPLWVREKLFQRSLLTKELKRLAPSVRWEDRLLFAEHHESHAASAFFPSPFDRAAILTLDGVGEWTTTSASVGDGNAIELLRELHFPHSLGLLYSAFTYYLGFRVNSGEYKVMGLAPYGEPRFEATIRKHLIDLKPDGTFRLDLRYFDYCTGLRMTNARFDALFGGAPRVPESDIRRRDMDLAASIQAVIDEAILRLSRSLHADTGLDDLCMAGGVALNCVANAKVLADGRFKRLWVQPAAGDAGGALGAAFTAHHRFAGEPRPSPRGDAMRGALLGPGFSGETIARRLDALGAHYDELAEEEMVVRVAEHLADGKVVGWFQGRMEFGPRALGARSILADPRRPDMKRIINEKVKLREGFRPFAPAVPWEAAADWFALDQPAPYMVTVAGLAAHRRAEPSAIAHDAQANDGPGPIPAVTHVDFSARVQTVHAETNPLFHRLLEAFGRRTGCPVLVNTSFNLRGEPIVCTPEDAYRCFRSTDIDILAIGTCLLDHNAQLGVVAPVERRDD